jgi:hypothetical protein
MQKTIKNAKIKKNSPTIQLDEAPTKRDAVRMMIKDISVAFLILHMLFFY